MTAWTKVVTDPLGLAGFALALVFSLLARSRRRKDRQSLTPIFVGMAVVAMIGGLWLGYVREAKRFPSSPPKFNMAGKDSQQQNSQVQQSTTGPGSPAVQGVQGDVTIDVDQGSGPGQAKQSPAKSQVKKVQ